MKISIIIPVLNEAATIRKLLSHLLYAADNKDNIKEIIVVDGGSIDGSKEIVSKFADSQNTVITLISSEKGRAKQMNRGAKEASGKVLYFLHADSFPPKHYESLILKEVQKGNEAGCFRMKFNSNHWWLRFVGWLTQFESKRCRGGDQSQFITASLFTQIDGYDDAYIIYEDNDLVDRLYTLGKFVIIPEPIITSARRYQKIGVWRLQYHFFNIHIRRWLGASSEDLYRYYKKKIVS